MALYVNTNTSPINARRQLSNSTNSLDTSYERLASGLRINSAKDDAAGLQISDRLTSQINGLEQGNRNAQDGISYAQTAEGAMDEMTTMYQRIRTLALQSANGTNSTEDRAALQQEVGQLCAEIDRIANDTTFGGQKILDGSAENVSFQVGADKNQTIGVSLASYGKQAVDSKLVDDKTKKGGFSIKDLGATMATLNADKDDDGNDVVSVVSITTTTTVAKPTGFSEQTYKLDGVEKKGVTFDIGTAEDAQKVVENVDKFIQAVDSKRAELGAVQNRLESTIRNQSNVSENVTDARSRIRDTDFATETANMTQQSIIQQASQSILSQSNQRPQMALSLLG